MQLANKAKTAAIKENVSTNNGCGETNCKCECKCKCMRVPRLLSLHSAQPTGTYYTLGRPVQAWSLLNFP